MKLLILVTLLHLLAAGQSKTIEVSTAKEFTQALKDVAAGDTISLADGSYNGKFEATTSGTSSKKITLTGSKKAVISGSNYGFWLKANYWVLKGFSVTDSNKGVVLDGANHNLIDNIEIHGIKQEGFHFRLNSADNILQNSYIHDTGKGSPGYGEAVYMGSAVSNWQDGPDKSDRNQVLNNKLGPNVGAEEIDIKEGSCCGVIRGNTFDGTGMSGENYADSWIDVKGEDYTIEDNTGNHSILDGIQIHTVADSVKTSGCNNKIKNNKCSGLGSSGKCVADGSKDCAQKNQIDN